MEEGPRSSALEEERGRAPRPQEPIDVDAVVKVAQSRDALTPSDQKKLIKSKRKRGRPKGTTTKKKATKKAKKPAAKKKAAKKAQKPATEEAANTGEASTTRRGRPPKAKAAAAGAVEVAPPAMKRRRASAAPGAVEVEPPAIKRRRTSAAPALPAAAEAAEAPRASAAATGGLPFSKFRDLIDSLPPDAKPPPGQGKPESQVYTLTQEGKASRIQVILRDPSFYVIPCTQERIEDVLRMSAGLGPLRLNKFMGVHVGWKTHGGAKPSWRLAHRLSGFA